MTKVLALALLAACACGPSSSGPRRLWLDVPVDGTLALLDHQPPPY